MGVWKQRDPETKEFRRLSGSGKAGANGGHYTPTVTDNGDGTVTFGWSPSLAGMPEVEDQKVELPESVQSFLTPDNYEGTDSEKLQACFDALQYSGGVISIDRIYTLTDHIYVRHNSSANNNLITVAGVGKQAGIDFGAYSFQGLDTTRRDYGGVIFKDLWLTGSDVGFDGTYLIRLTFDNCMIRNFKNFLCCTDCLQSVYIMGCYIRASSSGIADGSVKETINATTIADLKIIGCVAEQGYRLLSVSEKMDGVSITDCCIEGYKNTPILLAPVSRSVNISNNYFESNQGTHIDLSKATDCCGVSIYNNWLCEWDGMETVGAIIMPVSFSSGYLSIVGNHCPYSNSILLFVPDGATDLTNVYAFGNYGTTNQPEIIRMLDPTDIVKAVDNVVTDEVKDEIVEMALTKMSSETWVFELSDGAIMERAIATASLTEFSSEIWTFTLEDGTVVSKEVSIV